LLDRQFGGLGALQDPVNIARTDQALPEDFIDGIASSGDAGTVPHHLRDRNALTEHGLTP